MDVLTLEHRWRNFPRADQRSEELGVQIAVKCTATILCQK